MNKKTKYPLIFSVFFNVLLCTLTSVAQQKDIDLQTVKWGKMATQMPQQWYASIQAKMIADSVLKYQTAVGGWSKNQNYYKGFDQNEWKKTLATGIGATIDNGATISEMNFLAKMYAIDKDERYKKAFEKGLDYIFKAQYDNGGWPQFFPSRSKNKDTYDNHITYNDNAMVNVMNLLNNVVNNHSLYTALQISTASKVKAKAAFDRGINCILKTQIMVNNKPTVWCAQHDEITLAPANARSYELASFSGAESVNILDILMRIENPSEHVVNAIKGAINWFENHKIENIKLERFINTNNQKDYKTVEDKNAPALWARFYDLETEKPYFSDRDGIKKANISDIGYERRNGYSWFTSAPADLLQKYPEWKKRWNVN